MKFAVRGAISYRAEGNIEGVQSRTFGEFGCAALMSGAQNGAPQQRDMPGPISPSETQLDIPDRFKQSSVMDQLIALATDFRALLEGYQGNHGLSLQSFPEGACGDASILLANHLSLNGFGPFRYICGRRGQATHAWLSDGELILDITADQFDDFDRPVFISTTSAWHDAWEGEDMHEAGVEVWGEEWEAKFRAAYAHLMG